MSKLPMNARMGLRDLWENPSAPAQQSLKTLRDLLGYHVDVQIDAPKLWSDLHRYYPDPETFAPNIVAIVQAWAECLTGRLQDEANAGWTEKLLDVISVGSGIVRARVEPGSVSYVKTAWSQEGSEFIISIPESSPPYSNDPHTSIALGLENLFEEGPSALDSTPKAEDNDWATVNMPSRDRIAASVTLAALPSVTSLARPESLFATRAPYHMILQVLHNSIRVQGSHQPSLQLLKEYFSKYARVDRNNSYK
ncbi:MAG: hypothetical protein Q9191_007455, partial [Dirinaria sp. TL-2023a]